MPAVIEAWTPFANPDAVHVRVRFDDGEQFDRELNWWSDEDRRPLEVAGSMMRYADHIDASQKVPEQDKDASRRVQHALAIETIFPELHHDPRLPA